MKVLILAYDFPPFVSVGGLRPYAWFKYLGEFGVEPIVITRQWANHFGDERDYVAPSATMATEVESTRTGTIIRTPYAPNLSNRLLLRHGPGKHRLTRRLVTAWYEIGQYYSIIGPKAQLYRAAREYLTVHKVDAIIATGEPFVLFRYADLLGAEFGVPWVADYRDPWSQNKERARTRRWEESLERRISASAAAITTANEFFRHLLAQIHPSPPPVVIPNGYDPEAMARASGCDQGGEQLTVAFTGTVLLWHPIESVFRVFDAFIAAHSENALAVHMIGVSDRGALEGLVRSKFPHLARNMTFTARLPNDELAPVLARANAFLAFNNYAQTGTKVFDYLAMKRPILFCYSDDPEARELKRRHYRLDLSAGVDEHVFEKIIEDTHAGVIVKDAIHLHKVLTDLHREFKEKGRISCDSVGTEKFSRKASTEKLAGLLSGLGKSRRSLSSTSTIWSG